MNLYKILFVCYVALLLGLFLYSFTQIDLSLTFSRITLLRNLVKSVQYIGYFNRPLSTFIYVFILISLTIFHLIFQYLANLRKISKTYVWKLIILAAIILAFSYNAFSYDIFNYIFDAKIITHYHQNPYIHKALDYPGDPMLSFMHWTQRDYPYGPIWLVITVPLSFLGLGYFLPTFFLFKLLAAASYLGSASYIGKIVQKINPGKELMALTFFGLQPLILIESLVSGHIDIVMVFFAVFAFYLLIQKKISKSALLIIISIGIKFATAALIPIYAIPIAIRSNKQKMWYIMSLSSIILMLSTVIVASVRTTFQPWYLIGPLSFSSLLLDEYYIFIPSIVISLFALLTYVPFLYTGNWNNPIPQILSTTYVISYILSGVLILFCFILKKLKIVKP